MGAEVVYQRQWPPIGTASFLSVTGGVCGVRDGDGIWRRGIGDNAPLLAPDDSDDDDDEDGDYDDDEEEAKEQDQVSCEFIPSGICFLSKFRVLRTKLAHPFVECLFLSKPSCGIPLYGNLIVSFSPARNTITVACLITHSGRRGK